MGKQARLIAAAGAYVIVGCFVAGADAWDPLGTTLGVASVAAATVGVGLVMGRWPAILVGLILVPALIVFNRAQEPALLMVFVAPFAAGSAALLAAAAVAVRKLADRRGKSRPAATAGVAAVLAGLAGTAWGVYLDHRVVNRAPERPSAIELERAGYRGVSIGMPSSDLPRCWAAVGVAMTLPRSLTRKARAAQGPARAGRSGSSRSWRCSWTTAECVESRLPTAPLRPAKALESATRWRSQSATIRGWTATA